MVLVKGTPFRTSTCRSENTCPSCSCPPPPCTTRVLRMGPSYIRQTCSPPVFVNRCPPPVVIDPSPVIVHHASPTVVVGTQHPRYHTYHDETATRIAVIVAVAIFAIIAIGIAVSISRDCRFLYNECVFDVFGQEWCTPVYDCKW